jgi:hypothetical protein
MSRAARGKENWCDSMNSRHDVLLLDSLAERRRKRRRGNNADRQGASWQHSSARSPIIPRSGEFVRRLRDQHVWWPCASLSHRANRRVGRESTQASSWGATAMTSFVRNNGAGAWLLSSSQPCLQPASSSGILDDRPAATNDVLAVHMPHGPRERTSLVLPF